MSCEYCLKVRQFEIHSETLLGDLIWLELYSKAFFTMENEWFCDKISVKTPEGAEILFPCYRWLHPHKRMYIAPATGRLSLSCAIKVIYCNYTSGMTLNQMLYSFGKLNQDKRCRKVLFTKACLCP